MTHHQAFVTLEALEKIYSFGAGQIRAVDSVSLVLPRGRMVALSGPSGSGKSTLLSLIGGLERPTRGRVIVDGVDLTRLDRHTLTVYRRHTVGFVFQGFNLVSNLSALDNVLLPLEFAGVARAKARQRAHELLAIVSLADHAAHTPERLSGGQQQRVAIARALSNDPPLILADDPIGNLDTHTGAEIVQLLQHLVRERGKTVIIAGYHALIEETADMIVQIRDGKILSAGSLRPAAVREGR